MNKRLLGIAVCLASSLACAAGAFADAQALPAAQRVVRAGTQAATEAAQDHFTGKVRVDPLFPASAEIDASAAYVTFAPGVRSAWHTHPAGQRLVVISGVGLTQEWGKPVKEIYPGDVVVCPAGVRHWHGAAPASEMMHLAVTGMANGKSVEWMEKVTDDQYNSR
ncbi:(R)-mandelonitrile lyase [Pseudomonas knackmussii]|uniref:(R)-mandelonitrile lyase n=1 Tax=Pseudomonas knackmussii TaxID=65741 RepID=UPI003BD67702